MGFDISEAFIAQARRLKVAAALDYYFQIPPGEVTIHWVYNDLNAEWRSRIRDAAVLRFMESEDPFEYMKNFPCYCYMKQNLGDLLELTRRQVNLLANMHSYTTQQVLSDIQP